MNTTAASYALTPSQLGTALKSLVEANQATMIWGPPGVGKSDVCRQTAKDLGMQYIDVRALLLDPVDLRGIPWRDQEDRTRWAPPTFLPPEGSQERFLLNLEELPSAPRMVQAALYQLVLDRKIGEYTLPEGARIVACGNRETDNAVVHRMPTPLASRFVHLDTEADLDSWIDWALQAGLATEVIFFLRFRPDLLMHFDPKSAEHVFPCPRTWHFVSRLVDHGNTGSTPTDMATLRGAIGEGAAVEFAAYLSIFRSLPDIDAVFSDPAGVDIPTDPSAMIALCGALCRRASEDRMDAITAFARRSDVRPELGEFLVSSCAAASPDCRYTRAFVAWQAHVERL